ncbi:MAG TPA: cytochrome c oxidase assembly protein [Dermatophilaceae bacterium]|nr:cytochrome c oxidase assembly protein [Dermatophilaceae bacterium]
MALAATSARSSGMPRTAAVLTLTAAVLACVAAAAGGGATQPPVAGLQDPGPVVRWGLPIVRAVHDLSAALTVGLLLLGAVAVPDRAKQALAAAPRIAVRSGIVWIASGLVGVLLGFGDIVGLSPTSSAYLRQLQQFVWSVESLREGLISALLAAIAVTITAVGTSRASLCWAGAVGLVSLFPLALAGHSATAADHETAVNALLFHLVGTVAWIGGLAALVALRPRLRAWLPVVLDRYSVVAGWALVTVGLSGIVSASVRMSGLGDLRTSYGALVIAKAVGLVVLGLLGLQQRRHVIGKLRENPTAAGLFARLVVTELAVMGATVGVATALSRSANPEYVRPPAANLTETLTNYPIPPAPTGSSWLTVWRWDWLWGTVAVLAIALYIGAVVRLHRRGDRWPIGRTVCWVLGWVAMLWATCGAGGVYGRVSFAWHMMSHMTIAMIAPVLLVLAAPLTLVIRVEHPRKDGTLGPREILLGIVHSRYVAFWANPIVAGINFAFSLIVFYYTGLFELALTTHTGHILMVVHFLLAGYLFAMVLVGVDPGPRKWAPALRLVVLFATISFHAFFGVALQSGDTLIAPDFFGIIGIPWIPDPLQDQRLGGAIAWGIGDVPSLALALIVVLQWVRSDAAEARRLDRQADRDGDAALAAYNDELARLARQDEAREGRHG